MEREKTRAIFIYLAVIAVIFGFIGMIIIARNFTGQATASLEEYGKEEILEHNSVSECWVYNGDKVYDITLFLQIYDKEDLRYKCGGEINLDIFDVNVRELLRSYEIGVLK